MTPQPSAGRPEAGSGQTTAPGRVVRMESRKPAGAAASPSPGGKGPDPRALATLARPLGDAEPVPPRRRWRGILAWILVAALGAGTVAAAWTFRKPLLARAAAIPWVAGVLGRAGLNPGAVTARPDPEARLKARESQLAAREAAVAAREQALTRQDQALQEREQQLQAQESALTAREEDLRRREGELQAAQDVAKATERDAALAVDMFRSLPPKDAAAILAGLSDENALYILRRVGPDQAASILREMDRARAARLTRTLLP